MTGAWVTDVRYVGPNMQAVYNPALSPLWRRKVLHMPALDATVNCPIQGAVLSDDILGARWDPDYVWPALPAPEIVEAPTAEKFQFLTAGAQMLEKIPPVIVRHIRTHNVDDPVVQMYLDLMRLLEGVNGPD